MAMQKIGHMMGILKGSVNDYVMRTCAAILKHREQVKRRNISGRIRKVHGFVNCIGFIDGTLFPLAFAPTLNGEDYVLDQIAFCGKCCFCPSALSLEVRVVSCWRIDCWAMLLVFSSVLGNIQHYA